MCGYGASAVVAVCCAPWVPLACGFCAPIKLDVREQEQADRRSGDPCCHIHRRLVGWVWADLWSAPDTATLAVCRRKRLPALCYRFRDQPHHITPLAATA